MEFGLGPVIGVAKKIPIIFNKVDLSIETHTTSSEIVYTIRNNGKKNIENITIREQKFKKDLEFQANLFDDFEKSYFHGISLNDFGSDKLYPINYPNNFKNQKVYLLRNLESYKKPKNMLYSYCAFIESNLSLLLSMAYSYVESYYKYLNFVDIVNNKNNIMEKQEFIDHEKLTTKAVAEEEKRLSSIIKTYLTNIIEFTNFIHKLSKKLSINHNLDTLKNIISKKNTLDIFMRLALYTQENYSKGDLEFLRNILKTSISELNVKPNKYLIYDKLKLNINDYIIIKKPIYESMTFFIKLKKTPVDQSKENETTIKEYEKNIEIKYEEFSILKFWTKLTNKEYRTGLKNKNITIKKIKWNRIEVVKVIKIPEITEYSSNIYDDLYK